MNMLIFKKRIREISPAIKSAFIYLIATVFSRGLTVITTPIFTRLMTTEQIGIVNLYNSWYSMIGGIASLSLTSGGFVIGLKEFKDSRNQYVSSVLSITSTLSLFLLVLFIISPVFWSNLLDLSPALILLMLLGFLFAPARDFWLARQRYEYQYKMPAFVMMGAAFIASLFSIILVIHYNNKGLAQAAEGRLFANYFVIYSVAFLLWIHIFVKGKTFFNKRYWSYSLKLSLPLVGYSIASQILNTSDRLMINRMVGKEAVGIYGTLYSVSSLSLMVWFAVNSSFEPYLYQNIGKKGHKIKEISMAMLSLYAVISIILVFFAPEIVRILATKEYYEAIYIMPPIAGGVFLTSVSNLYSDILVYLKKTQFIMFASITAAFTNVLLNAIFIPRFGYIAAAYTTMLSYILMALLLGISANLIYRKDVGKRLNEIYHNKKILLMSVVTIICSLFGLFLYAHMAARYFCIIPFMGLSVWLYHKFRTGKSGFRE